MAPCRSWYDIHCYPWPIILVETASAGGPGAQEPLHAGLSTLFLSPRSLFFSLLKPTLSPFPELPRYAQSVSVSHCSTLGSNLRLILPLKLILIPVSAPAPGPRPARRLRTHSPLQLSLRWACLHQLVTAALCVSSTPPTT